jgi:hypothetical protein
MYYFCGIKYTPRKNIAKAHTIPYMYMIPRTLYQSKQEPKLFSVLFIGFLFYCDTA